MSEIIFILKLNLQGQIRSEKPKIPGRTVAMAFGVVAISLLLLLPVASATTGDPAAVTFTSPNPRAGGSFGFSVAVSGDTVVVGAPVESEAGLGPGHAYIFSSTGALIATLESPNPQEGGEFGFTVAVSGTSVFVGARGEIAAGISGAGHAYIFTTTGALTTTLTSPNPRAGGEFGFSVAVSGDTVVVGAPVESEAGLGPGHAYIFSSTGALIATLESASPQEGGFFGGSVAVSGTSVVVGASGETSGGFVHAGDAYIFTNTGVPINNLTSPSSQLDGLFGFSVAVSAAGVVVGAVGESEAGNSGAGHAYIFSTAGSPIASLTSPNPQPVGAFGYSVAVGDTSVVVGASGEDAAGILNAGHAYDFSTTGAVIATLTSPNGQINGQFGLPVAVSGTTGVVGAPGETAAGELRAGHAYLFGLAPTSTSLSCNPSMVAVFQATSCTATVTDTSANPTSPIGTVTFSSSSFGSFSPSKTCTLVSTGPSTSSCSVSYTPSPGSEGTHVITGAYSGDGTRMGSSGTSSLTVTKRTSATSVGCSPFVANPGHPTTCSATVTDTSPGTPITPTGTVTWGSSGTGKFGSTSCISAKVGTITCTTVYTPSPGKPSLQTITATYGGDTDHSGSSGSTTIIAA